MAGCCEGQGTGPTPTCPVTWQGLTMMLLLLTPGLTVGLGATCPGPGPPSHPSVLWVAAGEGGSGAAPCLDAKAVAGAALAVAACLTT